MSTNKLLEDFTRAHDYEGSTDEVRAIAWAQARAFPREAGPCYAACVKLQPAPKYAGEVTVIPHEVKLLPLRNVPRRAGAQVVSL